MKAAITQALAYPRRLVRDHLNQDTCPHSGMFDKCDKKCQLCDERPECEWLFDNEEYSTLEHKPLQALTDALDFAICYVAAEMAVMNHDSNHCACEACGWLRESQRLLDQVKDTLADDTSTPELTQHSFTDANSYH
jgi:hypothetical protein